MNKFLAVSVIFFGFTLANAAYMSRPVDRVSSLTDDLTTVTAEPVARPIELAPVHITLERPAPPAKKKRGCIAYPMYVPLSAKAGGTETVKICS